jgi:hypothetical protein
MKYWNISTNEKRKLRLSMTSAHPAVLCSGNALVLYSEVPGSTIQTKLLFPLSFLKMTAPMLGYLEAACTTSFQILTYLRFAFILPSQSTNYLKDESLTWSWVHQACLTNLKLNNDHLPNTHVITPTYVNSAAISLEKHTYWRERVLGKTHKASFPTICPASHVSLCHIYATNL